MANLDLTELLYRAFRELDPNGRVSASGIKFPDISVNRACLSKPEDLILGKTQPIGVFSFFVKDIPVQYVDGSNNYTFVAVEYPIPTNKAHAEIRVFINEMYSQNEPPPRIRRQFRNDLANAISIVIQPK